MAIKVTLKNSVVQDSVPTTSHLAAVGELALNANINSLGIYMRASDNSIVKMAGPGSLTTPAASTTSAGIAELATSGETTTGTDTARVCTPAGVKAVTDAERTTSNSNYVAKAGSTLTGVLTMPNGSNSAPAINFGDSDSGIFGGTNTVSLTAGGTTRLTADTGVSVVGTLAVTGAITSTSDLTIADKVIHAGDTDTAIRFPAANTVSVETGGSERARVDSSGRLLVGSSSSRSVAGGSARVQVENTSTEQISLVRTSNDNGGTVLAIGKTRGGAIVQDNDNLGAVDFAGDDGADLNTVGARIQAQVDGTPGANDMPGRLVFSTTADGSASPTTRLTITSAGVVNVPDNGKFTAGASDDLQIYHDGSHSYLTNTTGNFYITDDGYIELSSANGGEKYATFNKDGAVELYYDDSKKLETTSGGVTVTGSLLATANIEPSNNIQLLDSKKLLVGNGSDLQIYHDGSNSFIDNGTGALSLIAANDVVHKIHSDGTFDIGFGTDNVQLRLGAGSDLKLYHDGGNSFLANTGGNLYIRNNTSGTPVFYVQVGDSDEDAIKATFNGAVELYYNDVKKLETTSVGVKVTGNYQAVDGYHIYLGTGNDLDIYHDGSNSYITNATGELLIRAKTGENSINCNPDGAVELYHDNSKKLETYASGTTTHGHSVIHGNISMGDSYEIKLGNADDLKLYHDGSNSTIHESGTGSLIVRSSEINLNNADNTEHYARFFNDADVELYYDGSKKLETTSSGIAITGGFTTSGGSAFNSTISFNDDASFYGASYHAYWDRSANALEFQDNAKATFGTGNDLQVYHNGTDSYVEDAGTGKLILKSDGTHVQAYAAGFDVLNAAANETQIECDENAGIKLYYNNAKKVETVSSGGTVYGNWTLKKTTGGDASGVSSESLLFNTQSGDLGKINCFTQGGGGPGGHGGALRLYTKGNNSSLFERFRIQHDGSFLGSDTSIGSLSDSRLKKNVVDYTYDLTKFKELKPKTFDWINPEEHARDTAVRGFLAQEVQVIDDYYVKDAAVINEKDQELITDGKPLSSILDANDAMYVSVIQQLMAKIETLETKVAALEGA